MITISRLDHRKSRPDCQSCGKRVSDFKLIIENDGGTWHIGTGQYLCDECLYVLREEVHIFIGDV